MLHYRYGHNPIPPSTKLQMTSILSYNLFAIQSIWRHLECTCIRHIKNNPIYGLNRSKINKNN